MYDLANASNPAYADVVGHIAPVKTKTENDSRDCDMVVGLGRLINPVLLYGTLLPMICNILLCLYFSTVEIISP